MGVGQQGEVRDEAGWECHLIPAGVVFTQVTFEVTRIGIMGFDQTYNDR